MKTEDIIFELDNAFAFMWNEYRQTDKREREIEEEALALAIDALNRKDDYEMVFKAQNEEITELKGQIEYLEKKLYFKQNPWEIDG